MLSFRRLTVKITFLLVVSFLLITAVFLVILFLFQRDRLDRFVEDRRGLLDAFVEARRGDIVNFWVQSSPRGHWLQFQDTVLSDPKVVHATLYYATDAETGTPERLAISSDPVLVQRVWDEIQNAGIALQPATESEGPAGAPGYPYVVIVGGELWIRRVDGAGFTAPLGSYVGPEASTALAAVSFAPRYRERQAAGQRVLDYDALVYLGAPQRKTFTKVGHLVIRYDLSDFDQEEGAIRRLFLGVLAGLLVVLLGLLNWSLGRSVVRPIGNILEGMRRAGGGDLSVRLERRSDDEIGRMSDRFNEMVSDLRDGKEAIEEYNRTLAHRVEERTSELRESEARARELRDHLSAVLTHVEAGVFAFDRGGRVVTLNAGAGQLLGVDPEAAIGADVEGVLSRGDHASLRALVMERRPDTVRKEMSFGPPGKARTCRVAVTPILDAGTVVVVDDVTELIYSKQLKAWREAVERVIHDIKNPLTPVRLSAEQIRVAYEDEHPDFQKIVDKGTSNILASVDNLERMLADFSLLYRRPRAGMGPVELNGVVERVLVELAPAVGTRTIERDLSAALPTVTGDPLSLWRLVTNIVQNALEAIGDAGTLTIATRCDDTAVTLCIKDTGVGIPPERLDNLFEPYFTTKPKGTGLGLVIARQIVEDHRGTIEVRSEVGEGTEVLISLPVGSR